MYIITFNECQTNASPCILFLITKMQKRPPWRLIFLFYNKCKTTICYSIKPNQVNNVRRPPPSLSGRIWTVGLNFAVTTTLHYLIRRILELKVNLKQRWLSWHSGWEEIKLQTRSTIYQQQHLSGKWQHRMLMIHQVHNITWTVFRTEICHQDDWPQTYIPIHLLMKMFSLHLVYCFTSSAARWLTFHLIRKMYWFNLYY